jgi:hypothetical protein
MMYCTFEYNKLLLYLLKLFKLEDVANNPAEPLVEFSITWMEPASHAIYPK